MGGGSARLRAGTHEDRRHKREEPSSRRGRLSFEIAAVHESVIVNMEERRSYVLPVETPTSAETEGYFFADFGLGVAALGAREGGSSLPV